MDQLVMRLICFIVLVVGGVVGGVTLYYLSIDYTTFYVVDALYFCIVVIFTVGYGDIVPETPRGKISTAIYALYWQVYGFGEFDLAVSECEKRLGVWYTLKDNDEKARYNLKFVGSLILMMVIIGIGLVGVSLIEKLSWVDTYYFVMISSTLVGYGDFYFKSGVGKGFAIIWLTVCGVILWRAFAYIRVNLIGSSISVETKPREGDLPQRIKNPQGRRIAVALSFIESQATLSWIMKNLAIRSRDTLYLIHVSPDDCYDNLYRDSGTDDLSMAVFRTTNGRKKYHVTANVESADLQMFEEYMKTKKVYVKVRIFYGNPKKKIHEAIKVLQLNCLILGRKETHVIRRMLLPRTSDFIAANASIPITIVSQKSLASE